MEPMSLGSPTASPTSPPSWGSGPPLHSLSLTSPIGAPYHHPGPAYNSPLHHQQHQQQGYPGSGFNTPQPQHHQPVQHPHQQQPQQTPTQSGFLPGFLMGEPVMSPSSLTSPSKLNRTLSSPAPQSPMPPAHPLRGPQLLKETLNRSTRTPGDKPSGPPTTGLMNSLNMTPNRSINGSNFATPDNSESVFPASPAGNYQEGESGELCGAPLANWVTVWGFPPSAASFILQQFGACGTVLQHVMPPNSNWMHIRFQTRLQATKALGKNAGVLGGSIMVGVAPCRDESVLDALNTSMAVGTPTLDTSVANLSSNLGGTPRSIRPLTQAYREAQGENKVVPGTNTPTRSTGVVTKAMGYMFGW